MTDKRYIQADTDQDIVLGAGPYSIRISQISNKNLGLFNVISYGAKGDGVTDDTAAILAAIGDLNNGGTLFFPPGTYKVSSDGANKAGWTANCLFYFDSLTDIQIMGYGAKFDMSGFTGSSMQGVFGFKNCINILMSGIDFSGTGSFSSSTDGLPYTGFLASAEGTTKGLSLFNCQIKNSLGLLVSQAGSSVTNLFTDKSCYATNVAYGWNLRQSGSGSHIEGTIEGCHRAFYIYDCKNIKADIFAAACDAAAIRLSGSVEEIDIRVGVKASTFAPVGFTLFNMIQTGTHWTGDNSDTVSMNNVRIDVVGEELIKAISIAETGTCKNFIFSGFMKQLGAAANTYNLACGYAGAASQSLTNLRLDIDVAETVAAGTGAVYIRGWENVSIKNFIKTLSQIGIELQDSKNVSFDSPMIYGGGVDVYPVRMTNTDYTFGQYIANKAAGLVAPNTNNTITVIVNAAMAMS